MEDPVMERVPLCKPRSPAKRIALVLFVSVLMLVIMTSGISLAAPGDTTRESVSSSGNPGNNHSFEPSISADGRYVAFSSDASNLVASDTNNTRDIFVRDRETGTTERVSVDSSGAQANDFSVVASISKDGRSVAFESVASNLVAGDTIRNDIFVRDRETGTTERVSVDSSGTQGNGPSIGPSMSADGRFVAFSSAATNLVAGDSGFNIRNHIFVNELGDVPPTINIPPAITQNATSPSGAEVSYTVTVTDDVDPNPTLSCDPASGSTFPIGTTTVTCTATDSSGNSAEANFDVVVKGAAEQISTLKEDVAVLGLQRGISQSLQAKLNDALAHLNADRTVPACNKLGEFISEVSAQSGKNIDPGDAQWLTTETNRIKAVLAC
jgi:HYR domain/WD40-like Beta Propeller Repeat